MYIIGITEKCNLRCRYCCYSGEYAGKRSHGPHNVSEEDIDSIVDFIEVNSTDKYKRIAFYGGEPLLNFNVVKYCVETSKKKWDNYVSFSVSTNGTLLIPEYIDWLVSNNVEIAISLDGSKLFHDRNRIYPNGEGSFDRIKESISYLLTHYVNPNISFHVALANVRDLVPIARGWHEDEILCNILPTAVRGLTPNFTKGVERIDYDDVKKFYADFIDNYQRHPEWLVLRVFLEEAISAWKERLIFEVNKPIEMSTCLPVNTKLYIDSNKDIAVCEKFSDNFRIGTVKT